MRPLGLLGGAFSGAPPFAGLGMGKPSANTYLRGDGVWAALSVAPFANQQIITSSGTFTVPAGVTTIAVMVVGGGGGGGSFNSTTGGTGGISYFGSYLMATGGGGGSGGGDSGAGTGSPGYGALTSLGVVGCGLSTGAAQASPYGTPGNGNKNQGGYGGVAFGLVPVTPGQGIAVTVGAGGYGAGDPPPGQPGVVIVRY